MNLYQTVVISVILSLPLVGLLTIGRTAIFGYRSLKVKNKLCVFLSILGIILMIGILAFVVIVLFAYGVGHTGKNTSNFLIVLAITIIPTYVGAYGIWRLATFVETKLNKNAS